MWIVSSCYYLCPIPLQGVFIVHLSKSSAQRLNIIQADGYSHSRTYHKRFFAIPIALYRDSPLIFNSQRAVRLGVRPCRGYMITRLFQKYKQICIFQHFLAEFAGIKPIWGVAKTLKIQAKTKMTCR
jgi:hypothetical protein